MIPSPLKLDAGGQPVAWIRWHSAATLYACDRGCWEAGEERRRTLSGVCAHTGERSSFEIGSIIAAQNCSSRFASGAPLLTNRTPLQCDGLPCKSATSSSITTAVGSRDRAASCRRSSNKLVPAPRAVLSGDPRTKAAVVRCRNASELSIKVGLKARSAVPTRVFIRSSRIGRPAV